MAQPLPADAQVLWVGQPYIDEYRLTHYDWRRTKESPAADVMLFADAQQQNDGRQFYFYVPAELRNFARAAYVSDEKRLNWAAESTRMRNSGDDAMDYLLQFDERVNADHLVCRVLTSNHRDPSNVITGKHGWDYVTSPHNWPFMEDHEKKRKFVTFDFGGLWEIIETRMPLSEGSPIRIEIVRHRALTAQGFGHVFEMSKPDFIQNADRRREILAEVERIEHGLATADHWNCVLSCGKLAERILTELGKQRLRGGKTFGTITTEEQLFKQTYKPMQDGFVAVFTKLAPDEMKWLPGALDMLKSWADENRHAGKNERQLLDADQHTAHACYGVLRDFVRLLMHLHRKVPDEIAPKPANVSTP